MQNLALEAQHQFRSTSGDQLFVLKTCDLFLVDQYNVHALLEFYNAVVAEVAIQGI